MLSTDSLKSKYHCEMEHVLVWKAMLMYRSRSHLSGLAVDSSLAVVTNVFYIEAFIFGKFSPQVLPVFPIWPYIF